MKKHFVHDGQINYTREFVYLQFCTPVSVEGYIKNTE